MLSSNVEMELNEVVTTLLEQFSKFLSDYYALQFPSKNAFESAEAKKKEIFEEDTDIYKQYSRVLAWCQPKKEKEEKEVKENEDEFRTIKRNFLENWHAKYFEKEIKESQNKQAKILADLQKQAEETKLKNNTILDTLEKKLESQEKYLPDLIKNTRLLLGNDNSNLPNVNWDNQDFRKWVLNTHKTIKTNSIEPKSIVRVEESKKVELPKQISYHDLCQQEFIDNVDKRVQDYKKELSKENRLTKFFRWFSPTRTVRNAALTAYDSIKAQPTPQFDNIKKWLYEQFKQDEFANPTPKSASLFDIFKSKKKVSRFNDICLIPTRPDIILLKYEYLPFIENQVQKKMDAINTEVTQKIEVNNKKIEETEVKLEKILSVSNDLQSNLNEFLNNFKNDKVVMEKNPLPGGGYGLNSLKPFQEALKKLEPKCIAAEKEEESLKLDAEILTLRNRRESMDEGEIKYYKNKFGQVKKTNEKAAQLINTHLKSSIEDVQRSVEGKPTFFTPTKRRAFKLSRVLGPSPQEERFIDEADAKIKANKKAEQLKKEKELVLDLEEKLALKLDSGECSLKSTLKSWYHASESHKEAKEGNISKDLEQEGIYMQITKERTKIASYRKDCNADEGPLAKLTKRFMQDASKSSILVPDNYSLVKSLDLNEQGIFVEVYGTKSQLEEWQKMKPVLEAKIKEQAAVINVTSPRNGMRFK